MVHREVRTRLANIIAELDAERRAGRYGPFAASCVSASALALAIGLGLGGAGCDKPQASEPVEVYGAPPTAAPTAVPAYGVPNPRQADAGTTVAEAGAALDPGPVPEYAAVAPPSQPPTSRPKGAPPPTGAIKDKPTQR